MPKQKPIPRTPKEISQNQLASPYLGTKPESTDNLNRGEQISRKDDTVKDIYIGLEDIDSSILYYFTNVIKLTIQQKNETLKVPIIYGSPERWKAVQQDGFYRDKSQKIMVPLVMFKRNSLEKNRNLGNKLDGNEANLFSIVEKKYTQRNQYDRFSVINNRIPQREFYLTVIPDYVTITYSCIVWTNYVEQMNKIVEAINYASDSYWGDKSRFKFRAKIDNFQTSTELNSGEDRAVKTTFNIILNGYIIPDSINKYLSIKQSGKFYSKCQVIINYETTQNLDGFSDPKTLKNSKGASIGIDSYNINNSNSQNGSLISMDILTYLNTNKPILANSITNITATFPKGWLAAPAGSGLSTSILSFSFFVNGQYIEPDALVSFVDNDITSTLTINPTQLGFEFDSDDEIVAVGKFE